MPRVIEKLKTYSRGFPKRQAGRRRLAWWAVLFQFAVQWPSLGAIYLGWYFGFSILHHAIHPGAVQFSDVMSWSEGLMMFPGFPVALLTSLVWTNIVCWLVPPVRRANDDAFHGVRGGSFREATGSLAKGAAITVPICILVALIGAWEPWAR